MFDKVNLLPNSRGFNFCHAIADKHLSKDTIRNFRGFLMRESQVVSESAINSAFLEQEILHLRNHVVIVSFVGQTSELHAGWLHELQNLIAPNKVLLHRKARWSFSYIRLEYLETTRKVLALTPYRFSDSVAIFQSWVPRFDPKHMVDLTVPVWISLQLLPIEYLEFAQTIARQIGWVLEEDKKGTVT